MGTGAGPRDLVVRPMRVPDRGDIFWIDFNPQAGREQAGRRPALILSPKAYNARAGLALACPITSQAKGYPFEVPLGESGKIRGVVLADHLKSLDWRSRKPLFAERAADDAVVHTLAKLKTLL